MWLVCLFEWQSVSLIVSCLTGRSEDLLTGTASLINIPHMEPNEPDQTGNVKQARQASLIGSQSLGELCGFVRVSTGVGNRSNQCGPGALFHNVGLLRYPDDLGWIKPPNLKRVTRCRFYLANHLGNRGVTSGLSPFDVESTISQRGNGGFQMMSSGMRIVSSV